MSIVDENSVITGNGNSFNSALNLNSIETFEDACIVDVKVTADRESCQSVVNAESAGDGYVNRESFLALCFEVNADVAGSCDKGVTVACDICILPMK